MNKLKSITTWIGLIIIAVGAYDAFVNGINDKNIILFTIGGGFIVSKDGTFKRI